MGGRRSVLRTPLKYFQFEKAASSRPKNQTTMSASIKSNIALPEELCRLIYEFAYSDEPPQKLCRDVACWKNPSCAECNDEIWAERFNTADIEAENAIDAEKQMFNEIVRRGLLQYLREDESLSTFLKR